MATKSTVKSNLPEETSLENLFDMQSSEPVDDVAVDNLLNEFAGMESSEVKVFRVLPNNKLSYIYAVHPSEFRFDDLRDVYEGGKFRLYVYSVDTEGKKQLRSSKQYEIEKPKEKVQPQVTPANDVAVLANAMMQSMSQGFKELGNLIIQSNQNKPSLTPEELELQFMNKMIVMKNLFQQPVQNQPVAESQSTVEKALDMLQKGIDLGKNMGEVKGESSSTDVLLETIRSFAPAVSAMVTHNAQAPVNPQVSHVQPAPQIPPVPMVTESNDMNMLQQQRLKMGLSFLVDAAERKLETQTYAEMALDNMSDDDIDALFSQENPVEYFAKIEPRININKEWFNSLINNMRDMLTSEPENGINTVSSETIVNTAINETDNPDKLTTMPNT